MAQKLKVEGSSITLWFERTDINYETDLRLQYDAKSPIAGYGYDLKILKSEIFSG